MPHNLNPVILIPARMQAQRFPGKPLADISGKPMILHVLEQAKKTGIQDIFVAAGDEEIKTVVENAGFSCVLTDPNHPSGSDRIYEALTTIDPNNHHKIIINLQGDLPVFNPQILIDLLKAFQNPHVDVATPVILFGKNEDPKDPNRVKAAVSWRTNQKYGRALYFSRGLIPYNSKDYYHHIGIYAYRRQVLEKFISLPVGYLEKQEGLEQLRALEAGMWIEAVQIQDALFSVDILEDLEVVQRYLTHQK